MPRAETTLINGYPNKILRWYYVASVIFLLQAIDAFEIFDRLVYGEWALKSGDKITESLNLIMIAASLLLFGRAFRRKTITAGGILALALVCFLLLSALWSVDPPITVRRGVIYLWFIIGTIGVAGSLDGDEVMDLLAMVCGLSAAATIVLLVISPSDALLPYSSALRGVFPHKNLFGQVMAIGTLVSVHLIRINRSRRLFKISVLIMFIVLTFLSKSSTAMLTMSLFCAVNGIVALFRKGGLARILGAFSIMVLVPTAVIVALNPDSLLEMVGKDPTLSGRTDLWSYLLNYVYERPILGWGFRAFWSPNNPAVFEISTAVNWTVLSAHNGLLEMLLEGGIVGTAFFLFLWVRNIVFAGRSINTSEKELGISSLLFCGAIFLIAISEPVLVEPGILAAVFFSTGLMCERAVRVSRRRRYPTTQRATLRVLPANAADWVP